MGDVAIEKLPDFNGDYGSQSGKGHVATLNSTRPSKKKGQQGQSSSQKGLLTRDLKCW